MVCIRRRRRGVPSCLMPRKLLLDDDEVVAGVKDSRATKVIQPRWCMMLGAIICKFILQRMPPLVSISIAYEIIVKSALAHCAITIMCIVY